MIRLNSVNSREIPAAGYDRETSELYLQTKEGTILVFHRVPFDTYQDFIEAKFKGRFVKKQLMGFYMQSEKSALPTA